MKPNETSRLYNLMKAQQASRAHAQGVHVGRFFAKQGGKKLRPKWQFIQYNPNIHYIA
jgi:hypothetical protein